MPRSLYGLLHNLYEPRATGEELLALSVPARRQLYADRMLPDSLDGAALAACDTLPRFRIAVVGGGFAGLTAAWYLRTAGASVTVFEATDRLGGRVLTDYGLAPGKSVEAGAELIGVNHPMWVDLAGKFGLRLQEVTTEDDYVARQLQVRLRFGDNDLTDVEKKQAKDEMSTVLKDIGAEARNISGGQPWFSPNADGYDRITVAERLDQLFPPASKLGRYAMDLMLGNDNCAPVGEQSYLGLLALVSAGRVRDEKTGEDDMLAFWTHTETHRCWGGNQQLATKLAEGLPDIRYGSPVDKIVVNDETGIGLSVGGAAPLEEAFDFAVLAAPPRSWPAVEAATEWRPADRTMNHGPAVKYLSVFPSRFWEPQGLAPSALWDQLGSVWEGTDRQQENVPPYDLSVYSGGTYVLPEAEYPARMARLYPGYAPTAVRFVDWPNTPYIWTGYSVPGRGQVCTVGQALSRPFANRLYFAGEQSYLGYFGYMEGALQSGARAARDIIAAICPAAVGISV